MPRLLGWLRLGSKGAVHHISMMKTNTVQNPERERALQVCYSTLARNEWRSDACDAAYADYVRARTRLTTESIVESGDGDSDQFVMLIMD